MAMDSEEDKMGGVDKHKRTSFLRRNRENAFADELKAYECE